MKLLLMVLAVAFALSGCLGDFAIKGTNADGSEIFKGSVIGLKTGKFTVKSNKGRRCAGTFDSINNLPKGVGKGIFKCSDGSGGPFRFKIEKAYQSGSGSAFIGGEKFKFTYGRQS